MEQLTVLIVAADQALSHEVKSTLAASGMRPHCLTAPHGVLEAIQTYKVHLVLVDLGLPEQGGLDILTRLRTHAPHIPVLGIVTEAAPEEARAALQCGAWSLVHPAWAQEWLVHTVRQAVHRQQVEAVNHTLQAALQRAHEALETARVQSEAMQQKLQKSQQAVVGCVHHLDQARQKGAAYSRTRPHTRLQPLPLRLQEVGESGTSGRQVDRVLTELEVSPEPGLICGAAGVPLSASEARVALMIKAGMKNANIAAQLYISPETVKTHRKNIRKKLGLQGSGTNLHAYLQTLDTDPDIVTTTA